MSDREEIKLEIKTGHYTRLFSNKRILFMIAALIMIFLILILNSTNSNSISPLVIILLVISTFLLFAFTIYISTTERIVVFDKEGIELRFGAFNQKSLWKSLEEIEFNMNPTMKKEQIVFNEKDKSWQIINLDFKEEGWNKLRELIYRRGEENKVKIKS